MVCKCVNRPAARMCVYQWNQCLVYIVRPGNGSPIATNVVLVLVLVVIRFSIPQGFVVSQPIVMKLFTHINDNILQYATVAEF